MEQTKQVMTLIWSIKKAIDIKNDYYLFLLFLKTKFVFVNLLPTIHSLQK